MCSWHCFVPACGWRKRIRRTFQHTHTHHAHNTQDFRVPREVVWLLGAPGAGKGVNTSHILRTRGLTKSFHISHLLDAFPESRRLIDAGEMVPDSLVGGRVSGGCASGV